MNYFESRRARKKRLEKSLGKIGKSRVKEKPKTGEWKGKIDQKNREGDENNHMQTQRIKRGVNNLVELRSGSGF
jgi:hypothetical protein